MRRLIGAAVALAFAVGCSGSDDEPGVSAECAGAFAAWAEVPYSVDGSTDDEANAAGDRTLEACTTGDEWIAGLRQQPDALGLTDRAEIGRADLEFMCEAEASRTTPACSG